MALASGRVSHTGKSIGGGLGDVRGGRYSNDGGWYGIARYEREQAQQGESSEATEEDSREERERERWEHKAGQWGDGMIELSVCRDQSCDMDKYMWCVGTVTVR
ncbi:unnamed protein product [Arctogadus glacialis]